MPIRRRRNGSWLIDFYGPDGKRVRKTLPKDLTRREVGSVEAKLRVEADRGRRRKGLGPTFGDMLARYWNEHGQHIASWDREASLLESWSRSVGDSTLLTAVDADMVSGVIARWRTEPEVPKSRRKPVLVSPSTINRRVSCLRRAWNIATDVWGWDLHRIPWRRLHLDEPDQPDRSVGTDVRWAYIEALPERSRWVTLLALLTGLRRGALLRLERKDIDLERSIIRAVSKGRAGGKVTPVPITQAVLTVLHAMAPLPDVGRIFTVTKDQLRVDRVKAREKVGLPDLRFHDFRHTYAQDLEDAGAGDVITAALHHSDPRLRKRYAKARVERIGERLDEVQQKVLGARLGTRKRDA